MQINNAQDLDTAIALLENKKATQEKMLRLQFTETVDSFTPKNLIKAAYKNATESSGVGSTLLKAAAGVGSTILGGKLLAGNSLLGKLAGSAINAGAGDTVFNNSNKIMAWGKAIMSNLFTKK
jgi:type VI protein secretion system component Hcp